MTSSHKMLWFSDYDFLAKLVEPTLRGLRSEVSKICDNSDEEIVHTEFKVRFNNNTILQALGREKCKYIFLSAIWWKSPQWVIFTTDIRIFRHHYHLSRLKTGRTRVLGGNLNWNSFSLGEYWEETWADTLRIVLIPASVCSPRFQAGVDAMAHPGGLENLNFPESIEGSQPCSHLLSTTSPASCPSLLILCSIKLIVSSNMLLLLLLVMQPAR